MRYAIPLALLAITIAAFFGLGRGRYAAFGWAQTLLRILVALPLLASAVLLHFLSVHATAGIVPPALPARAFLVVATGVLEIAGALGLFLEDLRRTAALWTAILMVAVFPANVYAAGMVVNGMQMPGIPLRTAMQIVYIVLVLLAGYGVPGRGRASLQRPE